MLAFGMNGELPVEHGFPVRMLIPRLYGYVSACKWLTRIEATTFDAFDAYWIERDWAAGRPDQGRLPDRHARPAARVPGGPPRHRRGRLGTDRGIASIEVRVDEEDWVEAELSPEVDADLWRQWVLPYDFPAPPLDHRPRHQRRRRGAGRGADHAVPLRLHRLALHPGGRRVTTRSGLPAGLRLVPAPPVTRLPTAPAAGAPPRPRQCGRTDRTRSTVP